MPPDKDEEKTAADEEENLSDSLKVAEEADATSDEKKDEKDEKDEDKGEDKGEEKATYAVVPYDAITSITYEKSAHSRIAMGILLSPIAFFMKGKKHWLTIQFEGVDSLPAGYVYARLDKKTFQQVLAAIEAQLDIKIERIVEQ